MMLEGMDFDAAFETARKTFSYTNHTVMSEALERWDEGLFSSVVPELTGIIYRINDRLNDELRATRRERRNADRPHADSDRRSAYTWRALAVLCFKRLCERRGPDT